MAQTTPLLAPATVITLCYDEYTGEPALDNPLWQGATNNARSCTFEDWCFCWDDEKGQIHAQDADGNGAIWVGFSGGMRASDPATWEAV